MNKSVFLSFFLLVFFSLSLCYGDFSLSGINEAQFIYKAAEDSLSNYFYNETTLRLNYKNIEAGMSFIAELPKYDQFQAIEVLHHSDLDYRWDERYIQISLPASRVRAGSFSEFFGNGIIMRAFRDKAYDHDTRLTGLNLRLSSGDHNLKALYATLPSENNVNRKDIIGGLDYSLPFLWFNQLGFSFTRQEVQRIDSKYSTRITAGSRIELLTDLYDFYAEYAETKTYRNIAGEFRGQALYGMANTYLGNFTISSGYKRYDRFDDRMNDLPTLNASEEPLSERIQPGADEEGLLGQLRYIPDFTTEISVIYSEAWNSSFSIRQSDLFIEGRKDFDSFILGLEYAQFETIDKDWELWYKEITPALLFDFALFTLPVHLRTEFGYREETRQDSEREIYKPLLQFDIFFRNLSLSLISELEFNELSNPADNRNWFGLEATADLFSHTELKLFVGEERGGKVCRSGVCYYTTPFQGLRLDLITRF
jgi:hypothetical protein